MKAAHFLEGILNRALAQRLLQKRGFSVSMAEDGRQAIAAMQNTKFDVVLMDIQMPEMDGFEATAEIHKREKPPAGEHPSSPLLHMP